MSEVLKSPSKSNIVPYFTVFELQNKASIQIKHKKKSVIKNYEENLFLHGIIFKTCKNHSPASLSSKSNQQNNSTIEKHVVFYCLNTKNFIKIRWLGDFWVSKKKQKKNKNKQNKNKTKTKAL